jgi:hypothetical protein
MLTAREHTQRDDTMTPEAAHLARFITLVRISTMHPATTVAIVRVLEILDDLSKIVDNNLARAALNDAWEEVRQAFSISPDDLARAQNRA